jgi:hypothetical protein
MVEASAASSHNSVPLGRSAGVHAALTVPTVMAKTIAKVNNNNLIFVFIFFSFSDETTLSQPSYTPDLFAPGYVAGLSVFILKLFQRNNKTELAFC